MALENQELFETGDGDTRTEALKKFQEKYTEALGNLAAKNYPTDDASMKRFRIQLIERPPTSPEFQATVQQALDDPNALNLLYQTYARTGEALQRLQDMEF